MVRNTPQSMMSDPLYEFELHKWTTLCDTALQDVFWKFGPEDHELVEQVFEKIRTQLIQWEVERKRKRTTAEGTPETPLEDDWEHKLCKALATVYAYWWRDLTNAIPLKYNPEDRGVVCNVIEKALYSIGDLNYRCLRHMVKKRYGLLE